MTFLDISHVLKNIFDFVWDEDIMSCFTKLFLTNGMGKVN